MPTFSDIREAVSYIWPRRKTKAGLLAFILLGLIVIWVLSSKCKFEVELEAWLYSLFIFITLIYWIFNSGRRALPSSKVIIAFALKSADQKSQKIIDVTLSRVKDEIKRLNLLGQIDLRTIGTDIFSTNEQAEEYLMNRGFFQVIHGTVYSADNNGTWKFDMRNFFFSYRTLNAEKGSAHFQEIHHDINIMLGNRDWLISDENDFLDYVKVTQNIFESVLSIICITLARSLEHVDIALNIIPLVVKKYEDGVPANQRKIKIDQKRGQMNMPLNLLRSGRLRGIMGQSYLGLSRYNLDEEQWDDAIKYALLAKDNGSPPEPVLIRLALAEFHKGNPEKAEEYTDQLGKINSDHPIYLINKAFFSILNGQYSMALNFYNKARRRVKDDQIIFETVSFLSERETECPEEYGYIFAQGILIYNFAEKSDGLDLLEKFINQAQNVPKYEPMLRLAKILVKKYK